MYVCAGERKPKRLAEGAGEGYLLSTAHCLDVVCVVVCVYVYVCEDEAEVEEQEEA